MFEGGTALIVEDGNEYLESLSRFVVGPRWLQAHDGAEALQLLAREPVELLYLDMRFDRIELSRLLGNHAAVTREHNQDAARAWKFLQLNQGLFILDALKAAGFGHIPVILAYDFSREEKRLLNLRRTHSNLTWVPDAITATEIEARLRKLMG